MASLVPPHQFRILNGNVELIILITVLLLLFGVGGFYIYRGGWWGSKREHRNAGPVGNPLAVISVVVLIIIFVVWRLVVLLR
jgi:amino acid transporter